MAHAPFTPAWLADDPAALRLLPRPCADPAARRLAVETAAARTVEPAVLASLVATTPAQQRNLDLLARPGTTCVVTGQQAGLFGGPLFTLYKTAAAIVNARALAEETGRPCVPIFWLQNEDHDFEEIASCTVLGASGALATVRVAETPGEADRSIAARTLGTDVLAALDAVEGCLAGLSEADTVTALLRRCYAPGVSPDAAFRALIEALFAEHGLLVVDPSTPALREAALPVHRRAVAEAEAIADVLLARSAALEAAGFAVQVHVRPKAPLGMFHPEGPRGPRHRVEPVPGGWRLVGTDRVVADLSSGTFTTSALLRPILQDTWLPTAAYVGGPGEIAYFAQLPPLYEHFGLPMPMIVPRARFRVIDETSDRLLRQLDLSPDDLALPRPALLARLGRARGDRPDPDALEAAALEPLRQALDTLAPHARELDKGLGKLVEKTADGTTDAIRRLFDRYRRALATEDDVAVGRLDRLLARLLPGGVPQERVHGWPGYGARHGVTGFVDLVLASTVPFDGRSQDLRP